MNWTERDKSQRKLVHWFETGFERVRSKFQHFRWLQTVKSPTAFDFITTNIVATEQSSKFRCRNVCSEWDKMKSATDRIIERINQQVGSDLQNLHKCRGIVEEYKTSIAEIESKVSPRLPARRFRRRPWLNHVDYFQILTDDNDVPSTIKSTLAECRDVGEVVLLENAKIDEFQAVITDKLDEYQKMLSGVSDRLHKIRSLEHLVEYYRILQDIEDVRFVLDGTS